MNQNEILNPEPTEPPRNGRGWYLIETGGPKPEAFQRATTLAGMLDNRHNLEAWKMRQVATGLAARPDLVAAVATTETENSKALNRLCDEAMDAVGANSAATMGTALHTATELWDRDGAQPHAMFTEHVARYDAALKAAGVRIITEHIEQVVVNTAAGVAGMFDRIVEHDGQRYIADLKTGKSIDYAAGTYSIQLAIYATADRWYDWKTKTILEPLDVSRERALIIHLPANGDGCELRWLNIAAGVEALDHAVWVRGWQKRKDLLNETLVPVDVPTEVPSLDTDRSTVLRAQLPDAGTNELKALATRWPKGVPGPARHTEWTELQMDEIERVYELGFTTSDTTRTAAKLAEQTAVLKNESPIPETASKPVAPPDGPEADRAYCNETIARIDQLDDHGTQTLNLWIKQGIQHQVRWEHSTYKSQRRSVAARTAIELLDHLADNTEPVDNQPWIQTCIHQIINDLSDNRYGLPIGAQLGTMTIQELAAVQLIATTATVSVSDTGTPVLHY